MRDDFSDWQVAVVYPSRSVEKRDTHPFRAALNSRLYREIKEEDIRKGIQEDIQEVHQEEAIAFVCRLLSNTE